MQDGRDRVGLDLGPRHLVPTERNGVDILQRRRGRADDDDLVAEEPAREPVQVDARERDRGHRPRRAREVDQLRVVGKRVRRLPRRTLGGGDRKAFQALELVRRAPDDPAGVCVEVAVSQARAGIGEALLAAEELPLALVVDLGRREDEVSGRAVLVHERVVLDDPLPAFGGLAELDVVGDHLRACRLQVLDRLGVDGARERPALPELAERRVVDLHDHDLLGRLLLPPDREASVDATELCSTEDVPARPRSDQMASVGEQGQSGRRHPDGQEEGDAKPGPACHALNSVRELRPRTTCWSSGGA